MGIMNGTCVERCMQKWWMVGKSTSPKYVMHVVTDSDHAMASDLQIPQISVISLFHNRTRRNFSYSNK